MATVEKPAVINVDPEVQAAIDRALAGVRDPDRGPPPLPRRAGYPWPEQMDRK